MNTFRRRVDNVGSYAYRDNDGEEGEGEYNCHRCRNVPPLRYHVETEAEIRLDINLAYRVLRISDGQRRSEQREADERSKECLIATKSYS